MELRNAMNGLNNNIDRIKNGTTKLEIASMKLRRVKTYKI